MCQYGYPGCDNDDDHVHETTIGTKASDVPDVDIVVEVNNDRS